MGKIIMIGPAGEIEASLIKGVKETIEHRFMVSVLEDCKHPLPQEAFDPVRLQYHAPKFLEKSEAQLFSSPLRGVETLHLLLTHVDLYCPSLNYVFGYAVPEKGIAIVSTSRFRNKLFERTIKTAIHEIGHLFGLPHCHDQKCVMYFSFDLSDTDKKTDNFCEECRKRFLKEAA
ncbi:MAG: archaemetzincin family Zn-dependent metalloprotease [Thermodesulfovibrionales bacterium]